MKNLSATVLIATLALGLAAAGPAAAPVFITVTAGFNCHTQGFTVLDNNLYVTCAERIKQRALVLRYRLPAGFPADGQRLSNPDVTDLTRGSQWHPSGIDTDGKNLWLAVAEYRAHSKATLLRLDPFTMKPLAEFPVNDHIGAVAVFGAEVWGFNWDARDLYRFSTDGKLIEKQESPVKTAFQDCAGGTGGPGPFVLCSGPAPEDKKAAAVERFFIRDGRMANDREATISAPGRTPLGREGFAILPDGRLAFLPGDLPKAEIIIAGE